MASERVEFDVKRDLGPTIGLWALVVVLVAAGFVMLTGLVDTPAPIRWGLGPLLVLMAVFVTWVQVGVGYMVVDGTLRVYQGPIRQSIPLASISSVEPSRSPTAAPAPSMDRLEVKYLEGTVEKSILISPDDAAFFMRTLTDMDPGLEYGDGLKLHRP